MVSTIRQEAMSCVADVKWRTILNVCGICSEVFRLWKHQDASVLDEYYWLNKHDPNYSLCRATVEPRRGCTYRWQIQSEPEGLHGDHEAVLHKG